MGKDSRLKNVRRIIRDGHGPELLAHIMEFNGIAPRQFRRAKNVVEGKVKKGVGPQES